MLKTRPQKLYLDERHISWMSDKVLQHVLADIRPLSVVLNSSRMGVLIHLFVPESFRNYAQKLTRTSVLEVLQTRRKERLRYTGVVREHFASYSCEERRTQSHLRHVSVCFLLPKDRASLDSNQGTLLYTLLLVKFTTHL